MHNKKIQFLIALAVVGMSFGAVVGHIIVADKAVREKIIAEEYIRSLPVNQEHIKDPLLSGWSATISGEISDIIPDGFNLKTEKGLSVAVITTVYTGYVDQAKSRVSEGKISFSQVQQSDLKEGDKVFVDVAVSGQKVEARLVTVVYPKQ